MKIADISVEYIQHAGSDLMVANAARVSFDKESDWEWDEEFLEFMEGVLKPSDAKLLKYLANHKHFSPFNHSFLTLRIKAPICVARQLVKHRFMPWNEVSRRYVDDEPEFYSPSLRVRASNVKQGSGEDISTYELTKWYDGQNVVDLAVAEYNNMLVAGVAPEVARAYLPQSMMTEWIWSGTLGAYCDMLRLRLDPHTQAESRIVAEKVKEIITPLFPVSVPALLEIK